MRSAHRPFVACLLLVLAMALAPAWAQTGATRRVALVVGNNAYATAPLLNPANDARAMASALEAAGFAVILRIDATQPQLLTALREFGNRLSQGGPGTAGLFYFAGHGMQVRGRNFLVPVGANIEHEDELPYQAMDAQAVMDKMESAGNGTNIVILDACRNNPFARSFRSARQGLAQMDAPVGSMVAFSTAPGSVASDGSGSNGLYTSHLLKAIQQPGVKVEEVFKQVRVAVLRDTAGKQVPWEATSLVGDFYFIAGQAAAQAAAPTLPPAPGTALDPQTAIDDALWSAVKDSTRSAEIFAYLNRFPSGRHAKEARTRLTDLVAPAAPAAGTAGRPLSPGEVEDALRPTELTERQVQETIAANQRRIDEIVKWGDEGTDRRPANPRRNAYAFAEGDRYRYRVVDQGTDRQVADMLWRIDRIEADGSLWVNDGEQRLDAQGQLRGGSDVLTGQWVEWEPALPLATVASLAPSDTPMSHGVSTTVSWRDASGQVTKASLRGQLLGPRLETVQTAAMPLVTARRLEATLDGFAERSSGQRVSVTLGLSWWFAPGIGLPVRMTVEEREDNRLVRRTLVEVTALDVLSQSAAKPVASN